MRSGQIRSGNMKLDRYYKVGPLGRHRSALNQDHRNIAENSRIGIANPMSALGQKLTCAVQNGMSASPPKADIGSAKRHVRFVPKADIG